MAHLHPCFDPDRGIFVHHPSAHFPSYATRSLPAVPASRAPECFVSTDVKVTAACDVYSLAVLMNEMVTRARPWSGVRTAVGAAAYQAGRRAGEKRGGKRRAGRAAGRPAGRPHVWCGVWIGGRWLSDREARKTARLHELCSRKPPKRLCVYALRPRSCQHIAVRPPCCRITLVCPAPSPTVPPSLPALVPAGGGLQGGRGGRAAGHAASRQPAVPARAAAAHH